MLDAVTIVGASLAGFWAAETLRRDGFDGPVVLIGEEPHAPYDRPPLSKKYLAGDLDDERLDLVSADRLAELARTHLRRPSAARRRVADGVE